MEQRYDIIVAGSGISGSLAAASAAKNGAKVLLLDRNSEEEPGKKTNWGWVCGDAVAKSHIEFAQKELGVSFGEPELNLPVKGVVALSPNLKNRIQFDGEGYVLDRPKFAKKLRDLAIKFGAEYVSGHEVEGPIVENDKVIGVFGKHGNNETFKVYANLVIDSLGIASVLRRRLPANDYIQKDISTDDIESTGRYIVDFKAAKEDTSYYDREFALIHLNQQLAPGGYGWVFPKKGMKVNVGIGIEKHSLELRNSKMGLNDTLHSLIDKYVEWNPVLKEISMDNEHNNAKGYWSVTVRRQLPSLVYENYLGTGDSMAMPNPISAGGIGPAIISGILAGQTASKAVANKNTSIDSLWEYNLNFNKAYGSKMAGLEVFRIFLQSMNNDRIDYGMEHFITKDEAVELSYGNVPELSLASAFTKLLSGVQNISAFKDLMYAVGKMKKLNEIYGKYPADKSALPAWRAIVDAEMKDAKERFKVNPI